MVLRDRRGLSGEATGKRGLADDGLDGRPRGERRRVGISGYLLATFGVAILCLATLVWLTSSSAYRGDEHEALSRLSSPAAAHVTAVADGVNNSVPQVAALVGSADIANPDKTACNGKLALIAKIEPEPVALAVMRADGSVVCASDQRLHDPTLWSGIVGYLGEAAQSGHPIIHPGVTNLLSGRPAIVLILRLAGTNPPAFFTSTLPYGILFSTPKTSLPRNAEYLLLSTDRATVFSRAPAGAIGGGSSTGISGVSSPLPPGAVSVTGVDGVHRIYHDAIVPGYGWHVLVGMTPDDLLGPARVNLQRNLVLGGLTIAVVMALALLLFRALVRPVHHLRAAIEAAGADTAVRATVEGPAEIAAVAEAFNATAALREELEGRLFHQALHDPLTGLPNRTLLSDRLAIALARQARTGEAVAVCFLDIDRFKIVNDSHGHPAGDQLLVSLAARLAGAVRPTDTVARFGGDEFVVLADGVSNARAALVFADRLTFALAEPFTLAGESIFLSCSVGVAIAQGHETGDDLIRSADAAMYEAKARGRGTFTLYDEAMHTAVLSRLETESDLHQALASHQLLLHYQPKYSLATGIMTGVEALLRWDHPKRGLVRPAEFIPIAEETGLIVAIGEWVLATACCQAATWSQEWGRPVQMAVNLAPRQLSEPKIAERVEAIVGDSGLEPTQLTLEVTEGSLLSDTVTIASRLAAIRDLGARISIDDFGTGYSSLAYLRTLPLDEIKVDQTFVSDLDDSGTRAVVASIVHLGHALGLEVAAEGVETQAQLDVLRELGCDLAQGFYLSRPVTAEVLTLMRPADSPLVGLVAQSPTG